MKEVPSSSTLSPSPAEAELSVRVTTRNKYNNKDNDNNNDNDNLKIHVHSIVPPGIAVSNGPYGKCLIATQFFATGSILYLGYGAYMDTSRAKDRFTLYLYHDNNNKTATSNNHDHNHNNGIQEKKNQEETNMPSSFPKNNDSSCETYELDCVNSVKDCVTSSSSNDANDHDNAKSVRRQVFGFDGFMNHGCNPNVYCPPVDCKRIVVPVLPEKNDNPEEDPSTTTPTLTADTVDDAALLEYEQVCYETVALMDIHPGDEITCDYAVFDYDCHGHVIEECGCQAPNCRGYMKGFQHLSLQEQVRIMPYCDDTLLQKFFQDNPNICILEYPIPNKQVRLVQKRDQTSLVAAKDFSAGELMFQNQVTILTKEDCTDKTFILKLVQEQEQEPNKQEELKDGSVGLVKRRHHHHHHHPHNITVSYHLLDPNRHFIHRPSYVECLGFDTFMDHSCNPNAEQHYHNSTMYEVRARRNITKGETITCDYHLLDNTAQQLENVITSSFVCNCGADNCRLEINNKK